jgi:NAD(P)-dependent dehydrogenase (short-subunit alcohol dehydrogenase family)
VTQAAKGDDVDENERLEVPEIAPDRRLAGKTALVTGGGSSGSLAGSGVAISVLFAAKGAAVVVVDRDERRAQNTQQTIEERRGSAAVFTADITDPDACASAAEFAATRFGGLDILVNNAAIAPAEKGRETSDTLWQEVLNLDLRAAKLMSDAVIPHLRERGGGSIVNISSASGFRAGGGIAYTAAKHGLIGLTKALAYEYGRVGIRVNSVAPGHVHTPMGIGYAGWDTELTGARRLRAHAGLLGTEGTGWDVAYAALFLASDEASWITAVTVPVDAGTIEVMPIVMYPHMARAVEGSSAD